MVRQGLCGRCLGRQRDRCTLIEEFLQTEILYNDQLLCLREGVQKPLDSSTLLTPAEHGKIFGELKDLIYLSNRVIALLNDAIKRSIHLGDHQLENVEFGRILLRLLPHYSCYLPYIIKQETNLQVLKNLESTSEDFRILLLEADIADVEHLRILFLKPLLRIQKLPTFVDQILEKTTLSHPDRRFLQSTQSRLSELLWNIQKYSLKRVIVVLEPEVPNSTAPPKPKRKKLKKKDSINEDKHERGSVNVEPVIHARSLSSNTFCSAESSIDDLAVERKNEIITFDSLERAYNEIEKSIESIKAHRNTRKEDHNVNHSALNEDHIPNIEEKHTEMTAASKEWDNTSSKVCLSQLVGRDNIENNSEGGCNTSNNISKIESGLISKGNLNIKFNTPSPPELKLLSSDEQDSLFIEDDEFLFDDGALHEVSDVDLSDSIEEFDLRSKGSEFELSDIEVHEGQLLITRRPSLLLRSSSSRINRAINEEDLDKV